MSCLSDFRPQNFNIGPNYAGNIDQESVVIKFCYKGGILFHKHISQSADEQRHLCQMDILCSLNGIYGIPEWQSTDFNQDKKMLTSFIL